MLGAESLRHGPIPKDTTITLAEKVKHVQEGKTFTRKAVAASVGFFRDVGWFPISMGAVLEIPRIVQDPNNIPWKVLVEAGACTITAVGGALLVRNKLSPEDTIPLSLQLSDQVHPQEHNPSPKVLFAREIHQGPYPQPHKQAA